MDLFFDGLAITFGIFLGMIHPPEDLRIEAQMVQARNEIYLEVEVKGAWTPEVENYLLAGNTLTQVLEVTWGENQWSQGRSLSYQAWDNLFTLRGSPEADPVNYPGKEEAVNTWKKFLPIPLGTQSFLEKNLGKPVEMHVYLVQDPQQKGRFKALWGYKTPSRSLLYRTWLEVPR